MITPATPLHREAARRARWNELSTPLLRALIALLASVPLLLAAAVAAPSALGPIVGIDTLLLAVLVGVAAALGLLLTPALSLMGRIGAALLATSAGGLWLVRALTGEPDSDSATALILLGQILLMGIPAGYFTLFFGALRAAGWGRQGPWVVAALGLLLSAALFLIPSGPLADSDMANRMVQHGLINVGVVVAILAAVIDWARRRLPRGHAHNATDDAGGSSLAR